MAKAVLLRGLMVVVVAMLAGCQLLRPAADYPPLLAPATAGVALQASQRLTLNPEGESHSLLAILEVSSAQLRITALSGLGQRLMEIAFQAGELRQRRYLDEIPALPSESIVAQLQLAYWPLETLQSAWRSPWRVEQRADQRILWVEEQPLITVTYRPSVGGAQSQDARWPDPATTLWIEDHRLAMTLKVETLQSQLTVVPN